MASTKFINECKNGANSNRLGKISVETIKKVSGTKLELSNTLDKKISPRLYGYTKQNVYSGKQLFDANNRIGSPSATKDENDWITITADNSQGTTNKYINWWTYPSQKIKENTKYAIIVEVKEVSGTGYVNICGTQTNSKAQFTPGYTLYFDQIKTGIYKQILTSVTSDIEVYSMLRTFATFLPGASGSITFRISVIEDTNVSTDNFKYEPYVGGKASPNPDYPQEIEVGKGKNLWNEQWENGYYNRTTGEKGNGNNYIRCVDYIPIEPNTTIYFNKPTDFLNYAVLFYDSSFKKIGDPATANNTSMAFTTPSNASYFTFYGDTGVSGATYQNNLMINKGDVSARYSPYKSISARSTGKNLLKGLGTPIKNSDYWYVVNEYYFTPLEDGWGKFEYDNTNGTSVVFINAKVNLSAVNLKENTTYTILTEIRNSNISENTGAFFQIVTSNSTVAFSEAKNYTHNDINNGGIFKKVLKTKESFNGVDVAIDSYLRLSAGTKGTVETRITLVEGDYTNENLAYEPYKESSITYNLGDNFLADKDYIENGVLNKNIGKVVLNGSENWGLYSNDNEGISFWLELSGSIKGFNTSICDKYTNITQAWSDKYKNEYGIYSDHWNYNYKYFRPPNADITTVEQWKAWLNENPITMYYELETPEQIPLETTGELKTYEYNTIITNDANIKTEVEYSSWDTEITNSDNLTDVSVEDSCYVDGQIIGTTFKKKATSQLIAVPNDVDLIDKRIKVEIGAKYDDLSNEMVKMGNYTIERPKDEQTENFTQITAYDDFNSLDNPYVCNLDFSKDVTIADFYIDVCNQLELTPMKTTFLNSDIKVTANPFVNKETLRVVLQEIEKVSCTFSEIDYETNKIDLVWLSENEEPDYEFATSDYTTLEGGKITYGPVNCLVIKESQIEGENTVRQDDESITANGETQIAIQDSYFLFTQALREQAIDNIWNRVKGLTYVDCKLITSYGKPFLKVGKKIRVNVNDGRVFDTYVLKHTFKYDGAFESTIESPALTKQETKVKSKSISESIRLTEIKVDKALGTITSTVKTVKELEESIQYFSVDLSQYSLTIPTDSYQKPLETKNYDINYYGYYKGKQVVPEVSISGSDNTGITTSKTDSYIRFAVDSSTLIANVSNEYEITFRFIADDATYTLVKKVNVSIAQKGENGKDGAQGPKGETGATGPQGIQGPAGANGTSTYFYVKYSANSTGNPMTNAPTSTTKYMGVASTTSTTAPTSYSAYTWSLIKGADGINGTDGAQGPAGANGLTSYLHIKYSEDGLTFVPADEEYAEGEKPSAYIGQYVDYTADDSVTFSDYKWYKFTENIDETLNQMKGDINANNTSINNNYQELIGKFKDYTPTSQTIQLEQSVTQLQTDTYTKTEINTKLTDGSVTKVMTASGTFDENGMHYEKTGAPTKSTINESGVNVDSSTTGEELLFAGYDKELEQTIVRTENLTVRNYLVIGNNSRIEDYEDDKGNKGGGIFIL